MVTPSELLYFLGTGIYFTVMFLNTTMFADILPLQEHTVRNLSRFTSYGFIILKMLMSEKFTIKRILVYGAIALPILICYRVTGYLYQIDLFMFIVGARGIKADRIITLYFYLSLLLFITTLLSLAGGLIENRTFPRTGTDIVRNSGGFIYPTDFGARLFYMSLAFCYLVGKRFNLGMLASLVAISVMLTMYSDARLDAILIVIAGIMAYLNAKTKLFTLKWVQNLMIWSTPFFFFLSYIVTMNYKSGPFFKKLDLLLSKRLLFGYYNVRYTGIHPFGSYIYQQGHGALNYSTEAGYNFVDCGYLQALLQYGYVIMFFVILMFMLLTITAFKRGRHIIAIIIFLIGLTSCVDHHFLEFWYDPYPILIFSVIPYAHGYKKKSAGSTGTSDGQSAMANLGDPVPQGLSHSHDVWGQLNMIQKKY